MDAAKHMLQPYTHEEEEAEKPSGDVQTYRRVEGEDTLILVDGCSSARHVHIGRHGSRSTKMVTIYNDVAHSGREVRMSLKTAFTA